MSNEQFDELIQQSNFLGAYALVRESDNDKKTQAVLVGQLANALVRQLGIDRSKDDKESLSYHRSLLSYVLKDFPGLASLYREQLRGSSGGFVPEGVQDLWRDFNDVLSGRKSLDEEVRQRFDEAKRRAEQSGFKPDAFIRSAESGLRQGLEGIRSFFEGIFGNDQTGAQGSQDRGDGSGEAGGRDSESHARSSDGEEIKIRVENADDPLPGDIHQAQKVEKKTKSDTSPVDEHDTGGGKAKK